MYYHLYNMMPLITGERSLTNKHNKTSVEKDSIYIIYTYIYSLGFTNLFLTEYRY